MCEISRAWRATVSPAILLQMKFPFDGLGDAIKHSFRYATANAKEEAAVRISHERCTFSYKSLAGSSGINHNDFHLET